MSLITLIRPPVLVAKWAHTTPTCPPIGLAYLAGSLVESGMTVKVVDAIGNASEQMLPTDDARFLSHGQSTDEIIDRIDPATKVIGISCMFSHEWPLVRALIGSTSLLSQRKSLLCRRNESEAARPRFTNRSWVDSMGPSPSATRSIRAASSSR